MNTKSTVFNAVVTPFVGLTFLGLSVLNTTPEVDGDLQNLASLSLPKTELLLDSLGLEEHESLLRLPNRLLHESDNLLSLA